MKKITLLATFCFLFLSIIIKAQTPPNAFNYSAVARNPAGQPIATTTIGIQITILKNSPTGESQYSENHFVNTDAFGLFNLVIGAGAVENGSISAIDWSNDNYYLKVGMDANGGSNFLTMGTTQLLSVPYAMHAKTADFITNNNSIFNWDYPDGLIGEPVILNVNQTYTVPIGKNLYGLNNGINSLINSNEVYDPKMVPENSTISITYYNPGQQVIIGFLANKQVDVVIWNTNTSPSYTVPVGKTLYLESRFSIMDGTTFHLNGSQFGLDNGQFKWSLFPSGSIITRQGGNGSSVVLLGYLK